MWTLTDNVSLFSASRSAGIGTVRNSLALPVIEGLKQRGAAIVAYNPIAVGNMQGHLPDSQVSRHLAAAVEGASAALTVIGWEDITTFDEEFDLTATPVAVDDCRTISRRDGIVYEGFTWQLQPPRDTLSHVAHDILNVIYQITPSALTL